MKFIDKTDHLDRNEEIKENKPEHLVLHATHSYPEWEDLLKCHLNRGFSGVGYHIFVSKSGKVYKNRKFNWHGAHCIGFNKNSIGLCFYLGEILLEDVKSCVKDSIEEIRRQFPEIKIISHTQGQTIYLNRLLRDMGLDEMFSESKDVVKQEKFEGTKNKADTFLPAVENFEKVSERIDNLKNCPGETFLYFSEL